MVNKNYFREVGRDLAIICHKHLAVNGVLTCAGIPRNMAGDALKPHECACARKPSCSGRSGIMINQIETTKTELRPHPQGHFYGKWLLQIVEVFQIRMFCCFNAVGHFSWPVTSKNLINSSSAESNLGPESISRIWHRVCELMKGFSFQFSGL